MEVIDPTPKSLYAAHLPWGPVKIMPLGDVQYGSAGCDIPKLKDYIAQGVDEGALFIGMGDFHDVLSPSNRRKLASAALYDNALTWIEEKMIQDIDYLYEDVLKPTKGRWLGMLEGHHLFEFSDGSTTDTELCRKLDAPFLGTCGFLRLTFKGKGDQVANCDIWAHHGSGGGSTVGAILNKLERVAGSFNADVYFMGHANRLSASPKPLLELGGQRDGLYLRNRDRYLVATGAFDRGYMMGSSDRLTKRPRGGYVEQGAMLPTGLGAACVQIMPIENCSRTVSDREAEYYGLEIRATV